MGLRAAPNVRSALSLLARSVFRRRPRRRLDVRQLLAVPVVSALAVLTLLVAPAVASADSASTLTVVGTSDANDSGLIPNLIQPQFQKEFPQFTFKYLPSATGAAIQAAENGTGGPSALIVHAPSFENQFVAGGFSYNNQFGNAIFTNDFVIVRPTGDPAGVGANGANNAAQAFADIAAAGAAGNATFFGRGGATTASGTTAEEHQIWALVSHAGLQPAGLTLCTVPQPTAAGCRRSPPAPAWPTAARARTAARCSKTIPVVVPDHRDQSGLDRRDHQRVQRIQGLLHDHRPRHLRLPVVRDRHQRADDHQPEDRHP